jgi:lysyl-tRNA synthetase class 1
MSTPENNTSNYWLDQIADEAVKKYPTGEILVSSGISPSASYHVGHFREVLTADGIAWVIKQRGRQVRHMHVVDNFDPLRKRYHFLPEEYENYVGWPICLVPDPFKCHRSYATHYAEEFRAAAREMGVEMDVIYSYEDQYLNGKMTPYIEQALAKIPEIRRIFKEVSNRDLSDGWAPIQILSDTKSFNEWRYVSHDVKTKTLVYRRLDGTEGEMAYNDGQVKLNWRLDWPARWALWGVQVEPYGKEHATKGGSYDTGAEFARDVFDAEPPLPLPYDTINLEIDGQKDPKKMSSSLGNLVTPAEALRIMPAEILRFFVFRSQPKRVLYFDPGLGVYNLIDEFSKIEDEVLAGGHPEFEHAYAVASAISNERTIARVPFSHLVAVEQASRGDAAQAKLIFERTGYEKVVAEQWPIIARELEYVRYWLEKYAPASVKFTVQEKLPEVELSDGQRVFLRGLVTALPKVPAGDGQAMHEAIYAALTAAEIKPGEAFQAIYRMILGQDSGPKAGWFLASLDRKWLETRLTGVGTHAPH